MTYLKKAIIFCLVVALVSLGGDFCMHPVVQASGSGSIDMSHMHSDDSDMQKGEYSSTTINMCVFDCINQIPKATVEQKIILNTQLYILSDIFYALFFENADFFNASHLINIHPPSLDELASIFKRE